MNNNINVSIIQAVFEPPRQASARATLWSHELERSTVEPGTDGLRSGSGAAMACVIGSSAGSGGRSCGARARVAASRVGLGAAGAGGLDTLSE